jgi:phosphate/sulfate permease
MWLRFPHDSNQDRDPSQGAMYLSVLLSAARQLNARSKWETPLSCCTYLVAVGIVHGIVEKGCNAMWVSSHLASLLTSLLSSPYYLTG